MRDVHSRSPMAARRIPFLARLYRYAFRHGTTRRQELFIQLPLQKLFRLYRSFAAFPHWGEFTYQRFGKTEVIRFDARNVQFQPLYKEIWRRGYEQEVSILLDTFLPEGGTFYDIGSNWGYFSLYAASNRSKLTIHAFEPHPGTFRDLCACVQQAGLTDMVNSHNFALSNEDSDSFIELPDGLHSGSAEVNRSGRGTPIKTKSLDSLDLPSPDAIKLDVEGHELQVLQGGRKILETSRPYIIMESKRYHGSAAALTLAPLAYLRELGYELFAPSVKRSVAGQEYFIPCGALLDTGEMQCIESSDCLALIPFEPNTRFTLQPDVNVFACHSSRKEFLLSLFRAWKKVGG